MARPILSVPLLVASGCEVTFGAGGAQISKDGVSALARNQQGLLLLKVWGEKAAERATMAEKARRQHQQWKVIAPVGDEAPMAIAEGDFQAAGGPEELEEETARTLGQPTRPGPEQVAAHDLTHLPFAPWCAHCVQSRGKEMAHPKTADRVDAVQATICMDYFFLTDPEEDK